MSAIDEVKQKTDIVEVIGQYAALKKAGRNLTALCPFHSEKHPSFFVYPEQQSWHCFGACNTGGDIFAFVMRKEGIDFGEALRLLADRVGVSLPSRIERGGGREEKEELYQVNDAASLYFNNLLLNSPGGEKARRYVASRGFMPQAIADFQLGFSLDTWESLKTYLKERGYNEKQLLAAGLLIEAENGRTHDRFRGKLMFPIRDIKGRTIGFGARVLDDSLPKYVNSPQTPTFDKSSCLYGIDRAAAPIRQQDTAIIMEGYMDVITAHQNGITNVVASMGTAVTETQVNILKKLSRNLVLALDADTAGEEAMLRGVGYENMLDAEVKVIVLPEGKDPDDVIREDVRIWQEFFGRALPIVDFTFNAVTSTLDLTTARDKSLAVERLLPVVTEIKDPVRQAHYLQKLASLARVSVSTLEAVQSRFKPAPVRRRTQPARPIMASRARLSLISHPREEYFLALLLKYPELKARLEGLSTEYFESSENREIFTAWQKAADLSTWRESLDPAIREHLDGIVNKSLVDKCLTSADAERRYADCCRELKIKYLKSLAARKAGAGDAGDDIASLEEGVGISAQLKELFAHRNQKRPELRR